MSVAAGLRLDGPVTGVPGAFVREVETLPDILPGSVRVGPLTQAAPGALLFEVPGTARYLIKDGTSIEVAVAKNADRGAVALFLHNSARGTLIHQRGELPLNAVTLMTPSWKCVAICAPSALGKSTLAAALCRGGWQLMADGLTRVTWNGTMAVAWPSDARLQLWRNTCEAMKLDPENYARVRDRLEKFYVPVPAAAAPARLSVVVHFWLGTEATIKRPSTEAAMTLIDDDTYRPRQIDALGCRAAHRLIVRQVAESCQSFFLEGARKSPLSGLVRLLSEAIR
jgi:hypothetical protein